MSTLKVPVGVFLNRHDPHGHFVVDSLDRLVSVLVLKFWIAEDTPLLDVHTTVIEPLIGLQVTVGVILRVVATPIRTPSRMGIGTELLWIRSSPSSGRIDLLPSLKHGDSHVGSFRFAVQSA